MQSLVLPSRFLFGVAFSWALVGPAAAESPVTAYILAWQHADQAALSAALSAEAVYQDLDTDEAFDVSELSDYRRRFQTARFEVVHREPAEGGLTLLTWRVLWPSGSTTYLERVTEEQGKITSIESQGQVARPEDVRPILEYFAGRAAEDSQLWSRMLSPTFRAIGRNIPSEGYTLDQYRTTLGGYYYTPKEGETLRQAKDLRYYIGFQVRGSKGGTVVATGVDYFFLKAGKIESITGVY